MTVTLDADGQTGVVAIWTGDDDLPLTDPLNHLDRVKFHSSLAYSQIIPALTRTVTVNLPRTGDYVDMSGGNGIYQWASTQAQAYRNVSYTLFAHGLAYTPWVIASANIGGKNVAMTGSVPVQTSVDANRLITTEAGLTTPDMHARFLSVGADATNVYAFEYSRQPRNGPGSGYVTSRGIFKAISIPLTIWVTTEALP